MSQQFGIMVMIDVKAALKTNNISDHVYLIDNMRDFGSENEGTNALISKVNGTYWSDNSQAGEVVMNWLAIDINDLPMTVQRASNNKNKSTEQLFKNLASSINEKRISAGNEKNDTTKITELRESFAVKLQEIEDKTKGLHVDLGTLVDRESKWPLINTKGQLIEKLEDNLEDIVYLPPIITNITGEAVDSGVIFSAQYGSPSLSTRGWYWCASVNTATAQEYSYTVHVTLFNLVLGQGDKTSFWEPVQMSFDSSILISREAMKNGFTGGADSYLPIQ